ncbi:hypothetical protein G6F64_015580 [Rhizopus arrhizus]|uniref:Uncharacterized protein n=1 Tax=Rhizopus oryzae TaxID=64495 RepID=A0A9P6WQZ4_RHIOR|nr:hypothetical protein G6F64_015580 [Rhizopus arrhizus]
MARANATIFPWPPDSADPERSSIGASCGTTFRTVAMRAAISALDWPCTSHGRFRFSSTVMVGKITRSSGA